MQEVPDHLSELLNLKVVLQIEQNEDKRQYQDRMLKTERAQQVLLGYCWYPMQFVKEWRGIGGKAILDYERTKNLGKEHLFEQGAPVTLFSARNPKEELTLSAVVYRINGDQISFMLHEFSGPDWLTEGKIGAYLSFDESTYQLMHSNLNEVMHAEHSRIAELRDILLGFNSPGIQRIEYQMEFPELNTSQNKAIKEILRAKDIACIQGPPGTGKTTTLVAAVKASLEMHPQILVCAASNTAVDVLTEKLIRAGVNVTRLGHPTRVSEELIQHTLDQKVEKDIDFSFYKSLLKQAEEIEREARKFKRSFGADAREARKDGIRESKEIRRDALRLEKYIINRVLSHSEVIACTLTVAMGSLLRNKSFSLAFMDEAGQALEPLAWGCILKANKVIFVGDQNQLPPTVKSMEASKKGLSKTLFEKSIDKHGVQALLNEQYRMHETIMGFSNQYFYQSKLHANEANRYHLLFEEDTPMTYIDTAGCGYEEEKEEDTGSTFNKEEAFLVLKHLRRYLSLCPHPPSVGILSPYKAQVRLIKSLLDNEDWPKEKAQSIMVHTVDGFQGQEKDVIYFSMVRSNDQADPGFVRDYRRFNVALTRARKKLVVFGDSATLSSIDFFPKFLEYVEEKAMYESAYIHMYEDE